MSDQEAYQFNEYLRHVGHDITMVTYGEGEDVWNVAIECNDCSEVIEDYDNPEMDDDS